MSPPNTRLHVFTLHLFNARPLQVAVKAQSIRIRGILLYGRDSVTSQCHCKDSSLTPPEAGAPQGGHMAEAGVRGRRRPQSLLGFVLRGQAGR